MKRYLVLVLVLASQTLHASFSHPDTLVPVREEPVLAYDLDCDLDPKTEEVSNCKIVGSHYE